VPFAAEGRINTVDDARCSFELGAAFIVVGGRSRGPI